MLEFSFLDSSTRYRTWGIVAGPFHAAIVARQMRQGGLGRRTGQGGRWQGCDWRTGSLAGNVAHLAVTSLLASGHVRRQLAPVVIRLAFVIARAIISAAYLLGTDHSLN